MPLPVGKFDTPRSGIAGIMSDDMQAKNPADWQQPASEVAGKVTMEAIAKAIAGASGINGFDDPDDAQHSFVDGTRTFTVEPVGANFTYWAEGIQYTVSAPETVVIPNSEGIHYIYFDGAALGSAQILSDALFRDFAWVSSVYWNVTDAEANLLGRERHMFMQWEGHKHDHLDDGAVYLGGLLPTGIVADGSGDLDSHAQLGWQIGSLLDEDLLTEISAQAAPGTLPKFYRFGANGDWRRTSIDTFVVTTTGGGGRAMYNQFTGGAWQLTEITNNRYLTTYLVATNDPDQPMIIIVGQTDYTTLNDARNGIEDELDQLVTDGLPTPEFIFVAAMICQTSNGYANTPQTRIRTIETGVDYLNLTEIKTRAIASQVTSLAATAITVDITNFAGILSAADIDVQLALDTIDDHNHDGRYYTETEVDAFFSGTANYIQKSSGGNNIGDSVVLEVATEIGINTIPAGTFHVRAASGAASVIVDSAAGVFDASIEWRNDGTVEFVARMDDSEALDLFKLHAGAAVDDDFTMNPSGEIGMGQNPTATQQLSVTGDSTFVGLVGIGSPSVDDFALAITGAAAKTSAILLDNTSTGDPEIRLALSGAVKFTLGVDDTDSDWFKIAPTDGLTTGGAGFSMNSGGDVGIGADPATINRLYVYGNKVGNWLALFHHDGNTNTRYGIQIQCGLDDGSSTNYFLRASDGNGTLTGYLLTIGGVFQLVDSSDERGKRDLAPSRIDALDAIGKIDHIEYRYRKHGPQGHLHKIGYSAQQLQTAVPDAVTADEDGMLGVARTALIPLLTKANQQQQSQIDALRKRIHKLEARS